MLYISFYHVLFRPLLYKHCLVAARYIP